MKPSHGEEFIHETFHPCWRDRGRLAAAPHSRKCFRARAADKPFTENWAPSKWGKDDRAGSANHTKNAENVKRALATVKQFKSITVGKYYHREMPTFGPRIWSMVLPGTPQGGPFGKNALVYHDDFSPPKSARSARNSTVPVISA